jgi:flagellar hook assembly protein FlgD
MMLMLSVAVVGAGVPAGKAFALRTTAPVSIPTLTAPAPASQVSGVVDLTATSSAASVQFYVDASAVGAPVAVAAGSATYPWETWGYANGTHALTAADCDGSGCGSFSSSVGVDLENTPASITSPADGATVSTNPMITADAPGGAVRFISDGNDLGLDTSAPYSLTVSPPLTVGLHVLSVESCSISGARCLGATSSVSVTVAVLHPKITSVAPGIFSPNGDHRNDTTKVTVSLPTAQSLTWTVKDHLGATVRGPVHGGTLSAGSHAFVWYGKDNGNHVVADGTYTILVETAAGGLLGTASAHVRVDNTRPNLGVPSGANVTFYPVHDGYGDVFSSHVSTNEPGTLWLVITTTSGHNVRVLKHTHGNTGTFTLTWDGLSSGGHLVPQGVYHFRWDAQDTAGNLRTGHTYALTLSYKRLVTHTATMQKNGDQAYEYGATDTSCVEVSRALSFFSHGVWMLNVCDEAFDGDQGVAAFFSFAVPGATRYNSIAVSSYGETQNAPEHIGALTYNNSTTDWDVVGAPLLTRDDAPAWVGYGSTGAGNHVSSNHSVGVMILVPNFDGDEDYDLGAVRVTISYSILQ